MASTHSASAPQDRMHPDAATCPKKGAAILHSPPKPVRQQRSLLEENGMMAAFRRGLSPAVRFEGALVA